MDEVHLQSGIEELRRRMEALLGSQPGSEEAPLTEDDDPEQEPTEDRSQRMAVAGGALLGSAIGFLQALLPNRKESEETRQITSALQASLADCVRRDESGQVHFTLTLPDSSVLDQLADSLAQLIVQRGSRHSPVDVSPIPPENRRVTKSRVFK